MIYTIRQLEERIAPVAKKYGLRAVYLFGSYARGEAREDSDVDLIVDTTGTALKSLLGLGALYCELEDALGKKIDLITVSSLEQPAQMPHEETFRRTVWKEKVNLYVAA
ncbi:MAG TPA: nucleotidyltransferase domain-containing protein [Candidatus Faecalibacterium faecipullorum]|uniref:Nucleotidyltransferase domain-containing protein n=1 Tax=Candidatus Faecalibacterium faecipullorum TaxID=2838578 RepID=A0A9D2MFH0_9FIRM|nr:nucleotidyltransferase domain-containing protein [Candidatus Faecalibacterium faecipullorum]